MKHATWGTGREIHGWIPYRGREELGWVPVCYPNGAHPGWPCHPDYRGLFGESVKPHGTELEDERITDKPISCRRCLKRLGRPVPPKLEKLGI